MIPYRLELEYSLSPGWMAPFIDGLMANKAMARGCDRCLWVSFPPTRLCPCGREAAWTRLDGTAQIRWRTDGADGSFALVQFDGATTQSVVRLQGVAPEATAGALAVCDTLPQLILGPLDGEGVQ